MANHKFGSHADFHGNLLGKNATGNFLQGFGFEQLAAAPSTGNFAGRIYENTTDGIIYKRNAANTAFVAIGGTGFEPTIAAGTIGQYWRGDKTWQTLDKTAVGLTNVPNTDATSRANHSGTQLASTISDFTASVNTLITAAVAGLFDDRGNYDASVNTFPASGGSGSAGAILKGDIWRISVAGTLGGTAFKVGDTVRALVDTPGQTASNWAGAENNVDQATTSTLGLVQLATIAEADARTEATKAVTAADLVNTPQTKEFTFGDNAASSFVLTHNLNTRKVHVTFYDTSTFEEWDFGFSRSSVNAITVTPAFVPTNGQFGAIITARINA